MYTTEENCQIVIALLKKHGIRRVVASPGSTNVAFVGSVQNDSFFQVYSAVDERHAAYLAVGMAGESGEPVVLSCTGATASRNYIPALTEAYYRKLPILAVTSSRVFSLCGQLTDQFMDRTQVQKDVVNLSVWCPIINAPYIRNYCVRVVNEAILALKRRGGGPAHINLETLYPRDFSVDVLPDVQKIERYTVDDECWPEIGPDRKVIVWIGAHKRFSPKDQDALERFLRSHQAVAVVSPVSAYSGYGAISAQLLCTQAVRGNPKYAPLVPDLLINIGEISADYAKGYFTNLAPVWRVSDDGEIRDLFGKLANVFEMSERAFFAHYSKDESRHNSYLEVWTQADREMRERLPELPFCNNWIGRELYKRLPDGVSIHTGILSSVRSMGYQEPFVGKECFCNVGGFGIDGNTSSLIGASLVVPDKMVIGMVGDLSFFYDLNALGNRHIGNNVRLLIVNNGMGAEFTIYNQAAAQFGEHTADFVSAGGHFANQSRALVKHYAQDLGFEYMAAESQEEFVSKIDSFLSKDSDRSIVMECFVNPSAEEEAWQKMSTIETDQPPLSFRSMAGKCLPGAVKKVIKSVMPAS